MSNRTLERTNIGAKKETKKIGRTFSILLSAVFLIGLYYWGFWSVQRSALESAQEMLTGSSTEMSSTQPDVLVIATQTTNPQDTIIAATPLLSTPTPAQIVMESPSSQSLSAIWDDANLAYQNGEWDSAIEGFEKLRAMDDSFAEDEIVTYLANAYFETGVQLIAEPTNGDNKFERALSQFRNALVLAPEDERLKSGSDLLKAYLIGERAYRLGSLQQAIDVLLPLYERSPDFLTYEVGQKIYETYLELGDRAMRKGNFQAGLDYFGRASNISVADNSQVKARLLSVEKVKRLLVTPTPTFTETPVATPTSTPVPTVQSSVPQTVTNRPTVVPAKCADPRAIILSPQNGEVLSGFTQISGAAFHDKFRYFKLEYADEFSSDYNFINSSEIAVTGGYLGLWNTALLPNGVYKLRVVVVEQNGNYPTPCEVTVTIENSEQ